MKENKGVYVTKHDIRENLLHRNYQLYTSNVTKDCRYQACTREAGVQYNYRRDNVCTCRNITGLRRHQEVRYFSGYPREIYAYHGSRSYTDIGVGSVKALQKRKVKRVYLPETDDRGVGSSDLSSFISRRTRYYKGSYYDHKRTSSKCVGGVIECNTDFINEKLSPISHTKSGATSPDSPFINDFKKNDIGNNTCTDNFVTTSTQIHDDIQIEETAKEIRVIEVTVEQVKEVPKQSTKKSKEVLASPEGKRISRRAQEAERVFSSDSLVQHVHNLEHPSQDKPSPMSLDPMENKLEREYRKMFSTKSKDSKEQKTSEEKTESDMKSTSVLRRRFEALRRGLAKKEDSKRNAVLAANESSNVSAPSHRDVSIASDPPSLEARSYSNTKIYNPFPSISPEKSPTKAPYKKSLTIKKDSRSEEEDIENQGVKGMFKLWGKKFNLEDDECSPGPSFDIAKKSKDSKMPSTDSEIKKEGKKFFFFKKKSKDKTKQPYKQKKGVTAGRCEVGDGLMIKIGAVNNPPPEEKHEKKELKPLEKPPEVYEEILRKAWLQQFLAQTIESRNSVNIRWNNSAYATSSSTVFEIMENVYKDTGVVFRSKSEVTTGESSYYKSFTKQRVNFVQAIEAWMIPRLIPDKLKAIPVHIHSDEKGDKNDNIEVTISDHKWFIDKSKAFAHKIEVVLHSKNIVRSRKPSTEYLRIDIPKGFFSDSGTDSTGQMQTSNEEVYKIVEYESPESGILRQIKNNDTGDHETKDIKVTVSLKDSGDFESKILETVIKRPPIHRDVVIQGSNVYIPKRCNVIGVGIITQKDITKLRKPILKIQDEYSDEDSDQTIPKILNKSKFAESYLQDYYRQWTPLGMDFYSWCVSDSHIKCCSENSRGSVNQQGDGSKSCPNIYDDYQAPTIISSCGTSCCSKCAPYPEEPEPEVKGVSKFFSRFKKNKNADVEQNGEKRVLPKDSVEVSKRRKFVNESSNRSRWSSCPDSGPYSVPSIESKGAQDTLGDCTKNPKKACYKPAGTPKKKVCNKRVSMLGSDVEFPPEPDPLAEPGSKCLPAGILSFKGSAKCEYCNKGKSNCPKHAKTMPEPTCEIPPPTMPCRDPVPVCPLLSPDITPVSTPPSCPSPPPCASPLPCPSPPPCPPSPPSCGSGEHIVAHCSSPQLSPPKCTKCCPPPPSPPPCHQEKPSCLQNLDGKSKKPKQKKPCPPSPPCMPKQPCSSPPRPKSPPCPPSPPSASPPRLASPPCPPSPPCASPPKKKPCPSPKKRKCKSASPSASCKNSSSRSSSPPCSPRGTSPPPTPRKREPPCRTDSPKRTPPCSPPKPKSPPCPPKPCPPPRPASPPKQCPPPKPASPPCPPKPGPAKKPRSPPCVPKSSPPCAKKPSPPCAKKPSRPASPPCPSKPPCPPSKPVSPPCPPKPALPPCPPKSPPSPPCPPPRKRSPCTPPPCPPIPFKPIPKPPPNKCNTPPCSPPKPPRPPCTACKKCPSHEFPWPVKNQVSNQPSLQSVCPPEPPPCPPSAYTPPICSDSSNEKCKKNCSFRPECVKQPKSCPKKCNTQSKISGIFLKKEPSKKTCAKDCASWNTPPSSTGCPDKIRSEENFIINIKQGTVSTEEIREGMHIKVQDEDGQTLYERIDYRKGGRPSVLNDMYKSNVQCSNVSTSIVQNMAVDENSQPDLQEPKSEVSVANLIEINFKLKVTQGDKTTEFNIGNEGAADKPKMDTKNELEQTSHQVFFLKDEAEQCTEEVSDKNDINIKIIIKNYKPKIKGDNRKYSVDVEDFTQKISDKFQTVSTGYSDVFQSQNLESIGKENEEKYESEEKNYPSEGNDNVENYENAENYQQAENYQNEEKNNNIEQEKENIDLEDNAKRVYSVHRATINLASSNEMSKTQMTGSNEAISGDEYIPRQPIEIIMTSRSVTDKSGTEQSESKLEDYSQKKDSDVEDIRKYFKEKPYYSMTDTDDQDHVAEIYNTSDEPTNEAVSTDVMPSSLTKNEKKQLLKRLLEKACGSKKMKSKEKMKQLRDMLKIILTSDSSNDDNIAATSNELVKEMTYASLKPNYFRDTDSMNNYYNSSVISSTKEINQNLIYPTQNESQCSVQDSDVVSSDETEKVKKGCVCSTLAARLNMCDSNDGGGCCCRKPITKADEETCCDLRTEEDFFLLNYKTIEYMDVETQNSRFICNSTNLSVHSRAISGSIRNCIEIPEITEIVDKSEVTKTMKSHKPISNNLIGNDNEVKSVKVKRTFSPHSTRIRPCEMKKLNRNTMLGISDEDKVYLLNVKPTNVSIAEGSKNKRDKSKEKIKNRKKKSKFDKAADVLQCYETKKAVLEIYTEKTVSDEEERLVAKLPKFVYDKESEIERNYEDFAESYRAMKRNIVMMSVQQ